MDYPPLLLAQEILQRVGRWWWTIVAGVCLGLAGGVVALEYLPKTYQASTQILVAPPKIPQEYVRSPVTDNMGIRLRSLREAVLSRSYLEKIIARVYGEGLPEARVEMLMGRIRGRLQPRVEGIDERRGTGLFELVYEDEDPELAARLVNELAQIFIAENVRLRQGRAETWVETLDELSEEVLAELQQKERQISSYKAAHLHELPEQRQANLQLLASRQSELETTERSISAAEDRLNMLRAQRRQAELLTPSGSEAIPVTGGLAAQIAAARQNLDDKLERYTSEHPDVRAAESRLERLLRAAEQTQEDIGAAGDGASAGGVPEEMGLLPYQVQERSVQKEIAHLRGKAERIRDEIAVFHRRIERMPAVEQQLLELTKGYEILQDRHNELQAKYEEAKGSLRVEQAQRGQQFEIIDLAEPPTSPSSPKIQVVVALSVGVGLVLFVGPVVLLSLLRPVIVSRAAVEHLTSIPVLVSIPEVSTREIAWRRRRAFLLNATTSAASVAILFATLAAMAA